ncbi:MAG: glycoside hydrolase family 15 protein [Deltaproteobacteria bacterium]|nr:MAG: glycoside hydrolase family 15 protein [Deltaproteobacteria bacterium]
MNRIDDYAIIGDCRSAALVSRQGSIDWLCWPRFDSPSIFGALLDESAGRWSLAPVAPFGKSRRYVENTNVLQTRFENSTGSLLLTDLMPVASEGDKRRFLFPEHEILRILECKSGQVEVEMVFDPRPEYGRDEVRIHDTGGLGLRMSTPFGLLTLRTDLSPIFPADDGRIHTRAVLHEGDVRHFSLTLAEDWQAVLPPLGEWSRQSVARSEAWWREWASHLTYDGPARELVTRSALALKLLMHAPSGAIIAAPTTSLPERIGGDLNWDYRFCWLRDSSLTVHALFELGYADEAKAFVSWLLHATRLTQPELRILYDVYGKKPRPERTLDHLAGYGASRPVRVGNGAAEQLQLDVYGEVIHATTQVVGRDEELDGDTRRMLCGFGEYVCRNWQMPDEGIWEPRSGKRHNTHSRLLCWAALDCLLELHRKGHLPEARAASFAENRDVIRRDIETRAWNARLESYAAQLDGDDLDASLLLLSWHGFEKASSERMRKTYARIREQLGAGRGLLYRYRTGESPGEGAFGVCGFWGAEYLALGGGTLEEARRAFDELCGFANDVGLFAEEIDPATGEGLGNFPQAFTHVGLINAALSLVRRIELEGSMARERMPAPGKVFSEVQP